jgi:hypothetical protein
VIGILEDDVDGRQVLFQASLVGLGDYVIHDNAPDFLQWMEDSYESIRLLSLDHDLGPSRQRGRELFDPGVGMDVVKVLVKRRPAFPIIVHSSNPEAAPMMVRRLEEAGWRTERIVPFGVDWVPYVWKPRVRELCGRRTEP